MDLYIGKPVNLTPLQKNALGFEERNARGIWEKTPANWGCRVWVSRRKRCQKNKDGKESVSEGIRDAHASVESVKVTLMDKSLGRINRNYRYA